MTQTEIGLLLSLLTMIASMIAVAFAIAQQVAGSKAARDASGHRVSASYNSLKTKVVERLRLEVDQRVSRVTDLIALEVEVDSPDQLSTVSRIDAFSDIFTSGLVIIAGPSGSGKTVFAQQVCVHINSKCDLIADTFPADADFRQTGNATNTIAVMIAKRWGISVKLAKQLTAQRSVIPVIDRVDALSAVELEGLSATILSYLTTGGVLAVVLSPQTLSGIRRTLNLGAVTARIRPLSAAQVARCVQMQHNPGPGGRLFENPNINKPLYEFAARPLWISSFLEARHLPDLTLLGVDELADELVENSLHRLKNEVPRYGSKDISLWLAAFFRSGSGPRSVEDAVLGDLNKIRPLTLILRILALAAVVIIGPPILHRWWVTAIEGTFIGVCQYVQLQMLSRWLKGHLRGGRFDTSPVSRIIRMEISVFGLVFALVLGLLMFLKVALADAIAIAIFYPASGMLFLSFSFVVAKVRAVARGQMPWRLARFMRECYMHGHGIVVANNKRYEVQHAEVAASLQRRAARIFPNESA